MIARVAHALGRMSLEPVLVRAAVYLAGVTALLVAAPAELASIQLVLAGLILLPAVPALVPGGAGVTFVALTAVLGWLAATSRYDEPITLGRVLLLGGALYLLHSLAALAAALPYDGQVAPGALTRWVGRALLVVAASAVLSVLVLTALAGLVGAGAHLAATLAGLVVAAAIAALLSWQLRR